MTKKILINATQAEELRVAIVDENGVLIDLDIEASHRIQKKANIYKARVSRIESSLDAVFVEYGAERHGFLPMKELAPGFINNDGRPNLREGQEILIQVVKEERGTKGAAVTTFVSLAGCYLVLMPNSSRSGGVSRRIEGDDRQQLKDLLSGLKVPGGMSVIARTACLGRSQEELQWDLDSLLKLWETIGEEATKHAAPFLIYQESDVIMRSVRDYLRQDIDEILVDDRKTYERVLQYVRTLRPDFEERVRFYHHDIGLFTYYRVESQIETAFLREVKLPSGGAIVIDHTEALTSIDINSSKATKGGDIEETALQTNLEAAREIARQMKLRDLGGLLVIDFIDMENNKSQRLVEEELDKAVKGDRARIQLGKISRFGLLELSRQRLRPSLEEASSNTCPRCNGQGTIRGVESISLSIVRLLQEESMRADTQEIHVELPLAITVFLANEKRHLITQVEVQNKVRIILIPNPNLESPNYKLTRFSKPLEEGKPSYQLQSPIAVEAYQTGTAKVEVQEQPAIRALSIEKAPKRRSALKKVLASLLIKVQEAFAPANVPKKKKHENNGNGRNKMQSSSRRNNTRGNYRNERNQDRRRNQSDRSNINNAQQDRSQSEQRSQERREQQGGNRKRHENERNEGNRGQARERDPQNKPVAVPKAQAVQQAVVMAVAEPVVVAEKRPASVSKISPSVQAMLAKNTASASSAQVETTTPKLETPQKIMKQEVVEKTDFSVDAVRETVKKQHEQTGVRVETTTTTPVSVSQKYTKNEELI